MIKFTDENKLKSSLSYRLEYISTSSREKIKEWLNTL